MGKYRYNSIYYSANHGAVGELVGEADHIQNVWEAVKFRGEELDRANADRPKLEITHFNLTVFMPFLEEI